MLQQIRDKISGWFAIVFLGAIAVVFIFWGIRFESGVDQAAAKVNGEKHPARAGAPGLAGTPDRAAAGRCATSCPRRVVKAEQTKLIDEFVNREVLMQHVHARWAIA